MGAKVRNINNPVWNRYAGMGDAARAFYKKREALVRARRIGSGTQKAEL
jgi:hypothetical protein